MESLRKGNVVSFSGIEAEVTDFGVCLRQCDQQAASLRLELKSPDFWVCPPLPQHCKRFIISAVPGGKQSSAPLMQKSHAFTVSFLQDYILTTKCFVVYRALSHA